jgi:4-hydroxy-tetrahydrodipicolinate synthase
MISASSWRGVLTPLVTPFEADGAVDLDALVANLEWLFARGANAANTVLLAAGSGGDFTSMSLAERQQVIKTVAEVNAGRTPLIAGVQALDVRDCIALCQFCEGVGVDAVQISGPFYYDGRPGDVVAWMNQVARHTSIGFAIYNNWYTGYNMPLDLVEELVEIPNCVAIKWSAPSMETFMSGVRRFVPRVAVVNNTFHTIMGHLLGCQVFVSHWPNFCPEFPWRIQELMDSGRYREAQTELDCLMVPYDALVARIASQTAGEGVFVRPAMAEAGLNGGCSRLPSCDDVVTPDIRRGFRELLARASTALSFSR